MPGDPPYRDPDWLHSQYHDHERTQREIADDCGVTTRTIRRYMKRFGIETRTPAGEYHGLHGKERSEDAKEAISAALADRTFSEETREKISAAQRGRRLPESTRERISSALTGRTVPEDTRERMSASTAGDRNPNWQGGYSDRYGAGWTLARERVRERDEVCQHCGETGEEVELDVHHVIPVRAFRAAADADLSDAHELDNLVLLCKRCHALAEHGTVDVTAPPTR